MRRHVFWIWAMAAIGALWPLHVRFEGLRVKCGAAAVAALHSEPPAACVSHADRWLLTIVAVAAIVAVAVVFAAVRRSAGNAQG